MSYETALLIVVFAFCSYTIGKIEKLFLFSMLVSIGPLVYFTSKDYSITHFLVIASLCMFTRHRKMIPFMITFVTLWAVSKMPLELELISFYLALILSRRETDKNSLDLIMPLSLLASVVLEQHSLLRNSQLVNLFAPLMYMSLWHHIFLLGQEKRSVALIDGMRVFRLLIVGYLLPYKMSLILGSATSYIDPQLTNLGLWFILLVTLSYATWVLLRKKPSEMTSLIASMLRLLVVFSLWSGLSLDVHNYLLIILFVELIGQLIASALNRLDVMNAEVSFRFVILGYAYQFLFLPGSLGALIIGRMSLPELKHTDLVWNLTPYCIAALILLSIITFITQVNLRLQELKANSSGIASLW